MQNHTESRTAILIMVFEIKRSQDIRFLDIPISSRHIVVKDSCNG